MNQNLEPLMMRQEAGERQSLGDKLRADALVLGRKTGQGITLIIEGDIEVKIFVAKIEVPPVDGRGAKQAFIGITAPRDKVKIVRDELLDENQEKNTARKQRQATIQDNS